MINSSFSDTHTIKTNTYSTNQQTEQGNLDEKTPAKYEVEFGLDKPVENEIVLDSIILYLENLKASGGGDILFYKLDSNTKRTLTCEFRSEKAKQRVLARRIHKFQNYHLVANDPLDIESREAAELSNNKLIIRNLNQEDFTYDLLKMYCENLVINDNEENDVESIQFSKMFKDTVYVHFKLDFDFDKQMIHRIKRRPMLKGKNIEFMRAYNTKTLLIIQQSDETNNVNDIFQSHVKSLRYKEPFILGYFDSQEICDRMSLNFKDKNDIFVENLYNYDLLDAVKLEIKPKNQPEKEPHKEQILTKSMISSQDESKLLSKDSSPLSESMSIDPVPIALQHVNKINTPQSPPIITPNVCLTLEQEPRIKVLMIFEDQFFEQLKFDLEDMNATLTKSNDTTSIKIESLDHNKITENWLFDVKNFLSKFFDDYVIKQITVTNEQVLSKIEYDKLRVDLLRVASITDESFIYEAIGFKEPVDTLIEQIKRENQIFEEKKNVIISETVSGLKVYEIRILFVYKFIVSMRQMHSNVNIVMKSKTGTVEITG